VCRQRVATALEGIDYEHAQPLTSQEHGGGGAGAWDAHSNLKTNHSSNCAKIDQPIAALIKDLKQRGLFDETLVVWGSEFGRTPGAQGSNGRGHHNFGFSVFLAGGGIRGGTVHGATDEIGFHAVEDRHYVTDLHATVLRLLGLDPRKLDVPGRKRLEVDYGHPIQQIMT
jgi:arylsulfatase A-like enzyme